MNFRRKLRKESTECENILWNKLRNRQLAELRFLRQYSVGNYILDFYCPKIRLAVELDGSQHLQENNLDADKKRTDFLKTMNIEMIRYYNTDITSNLQGVLEDLLLKVTAKL